jgi:hypothetical protein
MEDLAVPLLKGDRVADDVQYRSQLPVNMYGVVNPILGGNGFMASHIGFDQINDTPGRDRGGNFNERLGQHLRVSGDRFIELQSDGTVLDHGPMPGSGTQQSQASMPYSFTSQAIITGGRMWLWDGQVLKEVLDPDLGYPIDGCWVDGYYFLTDGSTLYHTSISDESSIEPIQFATSEFSPDPTLGVVKTQDNQIMVLNRFTTEFFYDAAAPDGFAFKRVQGKATKAGIIGTHCKIEMNGLFFCLGSAKHEAPTMLVIGAGKAENFSTREVDNILSEYSEGELRYSILNSRTDDRDQLIYVHLPRHTLLYNHVVAMTVGKEFAWSELKSGVLFDDPWLPLNLVYDRNYGRWISGVRWQADNPATGYSTDAYSTAIQAISPSTLWVLDDDIGAVTAADTSGNAHSGTYIGAVVLEQPSFIDDNRTSADFGDSALLNVDPATFITQPSFAIGYIATFDEVDIGYVQLTYGLTLASVAVKTNLFEIELTVTGDNGASDVIIVPRVMNDGDVVILDIDLDALGVYSYTLYVNFQSISSGGGDVAELITIGTPQLQFYAPRAQYVFYKDGGLGVTDIATLALGYERNDGDYSTAPRGLVKLEPGSGSQDGNVVEYLLNTPFVNLESFSIDEIELDTIPGLATSEVSAFMSVTYDGLNYSREWTGSYSKQRGDTGRRFIFRRFGYCREWMGFRVRVVAAEKLAFANMVIKYG